MRKNNDCLTICLAILTGIEYKDCYYAYSSGKCDENWIENLKIWGKNNNLEVLISDVPRFDGVLDGVTIAVGISPREKSHAILVNNKNELLHDPHESMVGIVGVPNYYINIIKNSE